MDASGPLGFLHTPAGDVEIRTPLVGQHNLENVMLCLAASLALELDVRAAAGALSSVPEVPGRLERCDTARDDIRVLVDYAHTPDALTRALHAVRGLTPGRVICVFGCGGDRDADKRPKMGAAVGAAADLAIVTNDNPRSERPEAIAEAIVRGLRAERAPYRVVLDRTEAIQLAVLDARPDDVVLIAGKGHEPYQIIGAERRPFDDREQAREALAVRRARAEG
jgi:UDP-N-acetylmuramoyl-L-alanyl-D-glutamate--2,6-diaminopimelate ligase